MPAYKNRENGSWYVVTQYTDWTGARKPKCKRGFSTRREALEWEQKFQQQSAGDLDMSFEAFCEIYTNGITMLIVHHTRKLEADDKFDMSAGTNGLLGAADGGFVLYKEKRTSNAAILDATGRDQEDQRLHLTKNPQTLAWELDSIEAELWKEPPDPLLEGIAAFLSSEGSCWEGTASELCDCLHTDCKPNVLSLRLSVSSRRLLHDYDIHYKTSRNHTGRKISLWKEAIEADSVTMCDDRDELFTGGGGS